MEAQLSRKEKELVAVGASVAAGCIPCTQYHMKEVRAAGAVTEEITHAVDAALRVKGSSGTVMRQVAYDALGVPNEEPPSPCVGATDRLKELVSIAAAVAVNCVTSLKKHIGAARSLAVRDHEIQLVVALARMIRGKAMEKVDAVAKEIASSTSATARSDCGSSVTIAPQRDATAGSCGAGISSQPGGQGVQPAKGSCC